MYITKLFTPTCLLHRVEATSRNASWERLLSKMNTWEKYRNIMWKWEYMMGTGIKKTNYLNSVLWLVRSIKPRVRLIY